LAIDENQHKYYNQQCEKNRINELYTGLADRPIRFIRFNPDSYIDKKGNKIKSCFYLTEKMGKLKIDKKLIKERLKLVQETVEYYSKVENVDLNIPIYQKYLFYAF